VPTFLLVHSPLVGPTTMSLLADELTARGFNVFCPDLRGASTWTEFAERAAAPVSVMPGGGDADFVVAHSGAGAALPAIGMAVRATRLLFVDSVLPPVTGLWKHAEPVRSRLETMAGADRVLPPWNTWWNPNVVRRLVPDAGLRAAIEAECGPVPMAIYDSDALQPAGWSSPKSSVYIQLSSAYVDESGEARQRGWNVIESNGQHLDTAARPALVADLIAAALATTRVCVGGIESLRMRGGVTVPRNASKLLVIAPPGAGPFAIANECAHLGGELVAGYVSETGSAPWIECPLHAWRFDLATGKRLIRDEPSTDPLDRVPTIPCAVDREGMIWVEIPS
jgi:nitrite reductase/ring-hydroxylating ferredoxin subunit